MKRKLFTLIVLLFLCGATLLVSSSIGGATDEVEKGNTTAVNTLKMYLHNDKITLGEDFSLRAKTTILLLPDTDGITRRVLWKVEGISDEYGDILFLYDNDTRVVTATPSTASFVTSEYQIDPEYMNEKYHNSKNYKVGAFAWKYENDANLIISDEAPDVCSSIWACSNDEVTLLWCDSQNNPIWEGYTK